MVCIQAAGTITAPQAALLFIIAAINDESKKIYRFARFLLKLYTVVKESPDIDMSCWILL
jgi:hypothetical protein